MQASAENNRGWSIAGKGMRRFGGAWIILVAATVTLVYLCWRMLQPFVDVLLWAVVLAIVAYPLQAWLLRKTRKPGLSAILTCLMVIAVVVVPLTLLGVAVLSQGAGLMKTLPDAAARFLDPDARHMQFIGRYVDVETVLSREFIVGKLNAASGLIAARSLGIVGGALSTAAQLFFMLFTLYYLLRDSERILQSVHDTIPLDQRDTQDLARRTQEIINASVYGVLVIATIQGALGALAFWFLDLPSPILWGAVMIVLSMIPLAGAAIVWVPAALLLMASGHWIKAVILIGWGAVVIGMADNLLRPRLVGEKTRLHELLVFFSVLGGLQVFGVLGIVVGPVVLALTLALVDLFRKAERSVAAKPPTAVSDAEPTPASVAASVVTAAVDVTPSPREGGRRKKWKNR